MQPIIYVDILIVLNTIINYLLLLTASHLLRKEPKRLRLLLGSLLGGIYSLLILVPEMSFLLSSIIKLLLSISIVSITYKPNTIKTLIRSLSAFFSVSFIFAGIMLCIWFVFEPKGMTYKNTAVYFNFSFINLIVIAVVSYVLVSFFNHFTKPNAPDNHIYSVNISVLGKNLKGKGLLDTGNSLFDVFSGSPVIIVNYNFIKPILPSYLHDFFSGNYSYDSTSFVPEWKKRIRMIPCASVNNSTGLLPSFKPDLVSIYDGKQSFEVKDVQIAVSKIEFSGGEYCILLNNDLFTNCAGGKINENKKNTNSEKHSANY